LFSSCTKEDVPAATVVNSKVFALSSVGTAGVFRYRDCSGKSDATLSIELNLKTRLRAVVIPHTYILTPPLKVEILLDIETSRWNNRKSTTTFKTLDNGTAITYQQLLNFDGYINVHLSATNLASCCPRRYWTK
jgi:hypothetical protein